jgi:hypothetical protein
MSENIENSSKKPPLSLVGPKSGLQPPRKLGRYGMELWNWVQSHYGIADVGGVELLAHICAALDRAEQLAEAIERDGAVVYSRTGVPKSHPAVKDELACRAFIARNLERLGITVEAVKAVGRPGGGIGWTGHGS